MNTAIPDSLLTVVSFISGNLGEFTSYSSGVLAWYGKKADVFLFLFWDEKGISVQITDGVEPDGGDSNSIYTILGYCRYQGIAHELIGATLPKIT